MKVLVTGGCGFIGSHITDLLVGNKHEVVVVDNLSTGNIKNLNTKAKHCNIDICDEKLDHVFAEFKPEAVYHEAAQIDIQASIKNPVYDASVNILGSINVLNCCKNHGVKKIIYASTAALYGNPKYLGVDEDHPHNPISFYGISKYTPEHYIKVYSSLYGIKYTILRYANVYGIRQDPKGEGGVVSIFLSMLKENRTPTIFGDGNQTRDFVYVRDIAGANLAALTKADNEIINVGRGIPISVNELYKELAGVMGIDAKPNYGAPRAGDIDHSYFDIKKLRTVLGYEPKYSLREGLAETYDYYK